MSSSRKSGPGGSGNRRQNGSEGKYLSATTTGGGGGGGKKGSSAKSLSRLDRFAATLIGLPVRVQLKNGSVLEGVLHGISSSRSGSGSPAAAATPAAIDMRMVRMVAPPPPPSSAKQVSKLFVASAPISTLAAKFADHGADASASLLPQSQTLFPLTDVVGLLAINVGLDSGTAAVGGPGADSFTDTGISGSGLAGGAPGPRKLVAWTPDPDVPEVSLSDVDMRGGGGGGGRGATRGGGRSGVEWDQFGVNEARFGVKTTYSDEHYTTVIDKSAPDYQEKLRAAEQLAKQILREGKNSDNVHVREERGLGTGGLSEEALYGAVVRDEQQLGKPKQQRTAAEVVAAADDAARKAATATAPVSADDDGATPVNSSSRMSNALNLEPSPKLIRHGQVIGRAETSAEARSRQSQELRRFSETLNVPPSPVLDKISKSSSSTEDTPPSAAADAPSSASSTAGGLRPLRPLGALKVSSIKEFKPMAATASAFVPGQRSPAAASGAPFASAGGMNPVAQQHQQMNMMQQHQQHQHQHQQHQQQQYMMAAQQQQFMLQQQQQQQQAALAAQQQQRHQHQHQQHQQQQFRQTSPYLAAAGGGGAAGPATGSNGLSPAGTGSPSQPGSQQQQQPQRQQAGAGAATGDRPSKRGAAAAAAGGTGPLPDDVSLNKLYYDGFAAMRETRNRPESKDCSPDWAASVPYPHKEPSGLYGPESAQFLPGAGGSSAGPGGADVAAGGPGSNMTAMTAAGGGPMMTPYGLAAAPMMGPMAGAYYPTGSPQQMQQQQFVAQQQYYYSQQQQQQHLHQQGSPNPGRGRGRGR